MPGRFAGLAEPVILFLPHDGLQTDGMMIRNGRTDFGLATRLLHWVIALLILGLVALGFVMVRVAIDPALQFSLYQWHKSFGLTAFGLALLRLLWRLADRMPE